MKMVAVVSLVVALGCSKSKPATTPMPKNEPEPVVVAEPEPEPTPPPSALTDEQFETMMAKAIVMFNAMGAATDAAGGDCGKLADGLNQVLDDNASFIADAKQVQDSEDMKRRAEEWMKNHMDEIMGPMMKVGTAGQKCATDPKFAAFQKRFDEMN